ncbi:unnamed protein product [Mytilus coruscus]|uniref:Uncharacterized protein n=1 Tax=Mytilus coruscus TaxID=42192 RepID=A0A6J8CJF2_MYTCO|nr:unnamed protein product [Mytilus coruscus]
MSEKSNQDSIKLMEERYLRPENCENLCVPIVNKEIWTALPRQAHTVDSKMQETQRYFVKVLTPIVQLANHCCHGFLSLTQRRRSALRPYLNDKFKPICNSDVPVDSSLFGADCMKQMKELGDYTKIPIANPRFLCRGSSSNNNSAPSSYSRDQYLSLNSRGPVGRQGGRQFPSLRGRGRGFPTGNRGSQRGHNSQRGFYQNNHFRQQLRAFFSHKNSCYIGIRSDNTTAVAYIKEMGGMTSLSLDRLAAEIWAWCSKRDIFITAQYIPGTENFDADHMSRNVKDDSTNWQLKVEIFDRICKHFFVPNISLFASRLNFQIPRFASWSFDLQATFVDAFTFSWSNFRPYIFPPFTLLGKMLMKIISDKVEKAILIIPFWPAQGWFSLLIPILISLPVRLPQHKDLVMMTHTGECHPLRKRLNLTVCIVSGNRLLIKDFQNHL